MNMNLIIMIPTSIEIKVIQSHPNFRTVQMVLSIIYKL